MIFESTGYGNPDLYSLDGVQESQYDLGIGGALMHVYENECNFNAMMKSVGLSEMRYYQETGGDLFVNEAGAMSGFIAKAKAFFQKVIEKIKQIFKKFMAVINQFTMSDKQFVKKYQKDIMRKNITDMEFKGWENFKDGWKLPTFTYDDADTLKRYTDIAKSNASKYTAGTADGAGVGTADSDDSKYSDEKYKDTDKLDDVKEENRAKILGKSGKMDESEFRDEIIDMLYGNDGEKETFDVKSGERSSAIRQLQNSHDYIKKVEKEEKNMIKAIDNYIKALEKEWDSFNKAMVGSKDNNKTEDNERANKLNNYIDVMRSTSNDYTVLFGAITKAAKDCSRQAKALCVAILGYNKKESAVYYGESASYDEDDLFAGVNFL